MGKIAKTGKNIMVKCMFISPKFQIENVEIDKHENNKLNKCKIEGKKMIDGKKEGPKMMKPPTITEDLANKKLCFPKIDKNSN